MQIRRTRSGFRIGLIVRLLFAWAVLVPAASGQEALPSVFDDSVFTAEAEAGLHLLYNMKYDEAEARFERLAARYPEHPAGPFMQALNTWWMILTDLENEAYDKRFTRQLDEVIDRSERRLKQDEYDVDGLFFKGIAIGLRGRLRSNRGSWYGAARDAKKSYKLVVRAAEIDPNNNDYHFGWGLYDYFVDAIPRDKLYMKLAKAFFPGGDRERGIAQLERTFEHGRFLRAEAAYFLLQIHYIYEKDFEKSRYYVTWLRVRYPGNAYFHALEGRVYARWGRWQQALDTFDEVLALHEAGRTGYNAALAEQALYYRGRAQMAYGDLEAARTDFERATFVTVRHEGDSIYGVLARLRLGMVYDAAGQREMALAYYKQVLEMKDWGGSHARAEQYIDEPYMRYSASSLTQRD